MSLDSPTDPAAAPAQDKLICGPPLGPIYQSDIDEWHAKKRSAARRRD